MAWAISKWAKSVMGGDHGFHDHWKIPHISHPGFQTNEESEKGFEEWAQGRAEDPTQTGYTDEEQRLFLALSPKQKEQFQRFHIAYHIGSDFYSYDHHNLVGMHIDEAVYAGLYYGYGGPGQYADRIAGAPHLEERMLKMAPDTVLILLKCTPAVIRKRMKATPHKNSLVKDKDVELVLKRFDEEYERSLFKHKFTIDTSTATIDQCVAEFAEKIDKHLNEADRTRILVHKARQKGEWL
jgi:hypothetical protein